MQEEIIQPYLLKPVVEARRINLCGGHLLLQTEGNTRLVKLLYLFIMLLSVICRSTLNIPIEVGLV